MQNQQELIATLEEVLGMSMSAAIISEIPGLVINLVAYILTAVALYAMAKRRGNRVLMYGCGIGHVADARRLAKAHGEDPNSWKSVSRYLELKAEPAYYEHEVVKYGRFSGSRQTIAYVENVRARYARYCNRVAR